MCVPVFFEGEHLFTTMARAHQAECGNTQPTTYMPFAPDLYQEGALDFPCVRCSTTTGTWRTWCGWPG